jgi:LmbE family N-acetylglucosaminyl deacetylase
MRHLLSEQRLPGDVSKPAFDSDPSIRSLFCFTHPDDELAICVWVRRLVAAGAEVHLSWTHRTDVREAEARAMAKLLGVPEERLTFHAGEDGRVADQMPELLPGFRAMMERVKPDRVYTTAFEQGHLDHDATHCLVRKSFAGPVFEFPMYHPYTRKIQTMGRFGIADGEEVLELTREESEFKNRASKMYRSQNIRSVVFWYTVYRALCLRPAGFRRAERLRAVGETDFFTPNLPEPWKSEVARSAMWRRWLEAVRRLGGV